MHRHVKNEKTSWLIFFVVFFGYVLVSMTKNTYSSAMSAIVLEGRFDKSAIGLINAAFYLVYACTQMLGGYLVDKISPFKIFAFGVLLSAVCNAVMATAPSYAVMLVSWSINGFAQFGIWPAVIKIVASVLLPEHRRRTMSYLAFAYPVGATISFLVAAGVLKVATWPWLFWVSTIVLVVLAPLLVLSEHRAKKEIDSAEVKIEESAEKADDKKKTSLWLVIIKSGIIFMTLPAVVRCMLDVGLKSWGPTMIMENYDVTPSFASFLTTFTIVSNLAAAFLASWLYPKRCRNVATAAAITFVASLPFLVLLIFTGKIHLSFVVLSIALVTTFMTVGSQYMNVFMPAVFENEGRTGVVAGFLNSFGALGCMISSYLFGYLAENYGWTGTVKVWVAIALVAIVFCMFNASPWKKYTAKK